MPAKYTPEQRIAAFWSRVDKAQGEDACWTWTGATDRAGYGRMSIENKNVSAHRYSYETYVASIPEGHFVLHKCDTPSCVRPDHLFTGTHTDNMRDMVAKGRQVFQAHPEKRPTGDRSGSRKHPDRVPRGERVGGVKLTAEKVILIRTLHRDGRASYKQLAKRFGVSKSAICYIVRGEHWKHI